jgi:F0F1-type ATP synthase epsilon subunit
VDGGFLHVVSSKMETRVDILAEFAELQAEIDMEQARRQKEDAERRLAAQEDGTAEADLARALNRLSLSS